MKYIRIALVAILSFTFQAAQAVNFSTVIWDGTVPDRSTMTQFQNNPTFPSATVSGTATLGTATVTSLTDSGGRLMASSTAPTVISGFGTTPTLTANNTNGFKVVIGSGGTASTGVLGMPTAANGWACVAQDVTKAGTAVTIQTADTTTSVTLTNYGASLTTPVAWTAADEVHVQCAAY